MRSDRQFLDMVMVEGLEGRYITRQRKIKILTSGCYNRVD